MVHEDGDGWASGEDHEAGGGRKRKRYFYNDTGNAERLADAHGEDLMYCEERDSFYIWDGRRWKRDKFILVQRLAEGVIKAAAGEAAHMDKSEAQAHLKFISATLKRSGIENMVAVVKRKLRMVSAGKFDADPCILNFQNGTLDLRTGTLREHRRDDRQTKIIPYDFDPNAKAPIFHQFLERIMGGGPDVSEAENERAERLTRFLQVAFGLAITGIPGKVLMMFWGSGNNGKTTLLEIVAAALGAGYAGQLNIESLMANHRDAASNAITADLADLQGCRFVVSSEPEKGTRIAAARVKYLTGTGRVKARYLRENPFEFDPSHTIFIDANTKPVIPDGEEAIWNRVHLVPFTVTIPPDEIDITLPDKLRGELPGIMAWLAQGAAAFIAHGLPATPEVAEAAQTYRKESDRLSQFVGDECIFGAGCWVAQAELWAAYEKWARDEGIKYTVTKRDFDERIIRLPGVKKTKKRDGTVRAWDGVGLRLTPEPRGEYTAK